MIMSNFLSNGRYQIGGKGKAMVVADSRKNAVRYENIKRWLCGIRCKYYHPMTGNEIELPIGNDIEAIYSFLHFIYKLKNHIAIDDEELYELTLQIARSNSPVLWDEC